MDTRNIRPNNEQLENEKESKGRRRMMNLFIGSFVVIVAFIVSKMDDIDALFQLPAGQFALSLFPFSWCRSKDDSSQQNLFQTKRKEI